MFLIINAALSVMVVWVADNTSILLYIFVTNFLLYLVFYICMKFHVGERPTNSCIVFLTLSLCFLFSACFFFYIKVKDTNKSAAKSKTLNHECLLLNFYDYHDVWHFLGSFGLFFMLMFLLTLDDDIASKPQTLIQVW